MQDPGNGAVPCPCGCEGWTSPEHAAEIEAQRADRPGVTHTPERAQEMTAAVAAVSEAPAPTAEEREAERHRRKLLTEQGGLEGQAHRMMALHQKPDHARGLPG